jgi:hypothetical protein
MPLNDRTGLGQAQDPGGDKEAPPAGDCAESADHRRRGQDRRKHDRPRDHGGPGDWFAAATSPSPAAHAAAITAASRPRMRAGAARPVTPIASTSGGRGARNRLVPAAPRE